MRYRLACLDMAGTTISDAGTVEEAASIALRNSRLDGAALAEGLDVVRATMGQSKITVFRRILGDETCAALANEWFEEAYAALVAAGRVTPLPGAAEAMTALRKAGIAVAFTTGFSQITQEAILESLGWQDIADFRLTPGLPLSAAGQAAGPDAAARSGVLRGRPSPDLVLQAALWAQVDDVRQIVVAGDSTSDMGCGVRAGAGLIAGILGGAHSETMLRGAGATHILTSVAGLPDLLL